MKVQLMGENLSQAAQQYIMQCGEPWELFHGCYCVEKDIDRLEELTKMLDDIETMENGTVVMEIEQMKDEEGAMVFCNINLVQKN